MDLREETERIILDGYNEANAQAKLCQDIILKAIYESGMAKNATIKGGVVMRSISGNARRATQDIDIDLIRYSISDESIRAFISKLNCIEGLDIRIGGPIIELNHQDYKGKRVTITITDEHANSLSLKMDIGVHKDLDIEQDEYSFDIGFQEDAVSLLINSPAQMITEKLKSLLRFLTRSTRYNAFFAALKNQSRLSLNGKSEDEAFEILYNLLQPLDRLNAIRIEDVSKRLYPYIRISDNGVINLSQSDDLLLKRFFAVNLRAAT